MIRRLAIALLLAVAPSAAWAQYSFPTPQTGVNAPGTVNMCQRSDGVMVPCSDLAPLSVKVPAGIPVPAYPTGAQPITGIGTGSTGAVVGTLAAFPSRLNYICNVDVSVIGGTAAVGPIVIAGLTGGSFTYQASATAAGGLALSRTFTPCIPASGPNVAITVTTTADGTASAVDVNVSGFRL